MKLLNYTWFEKFQDYVVEFMGKEFNITRRNGIFYYEDKDGDDKEVVNESWLEFLEGLNLWEK